MLSSIETNLGIEEGQTLDEVSTSLRTQKAYLMLGSPAGACIWARPPTLVASASCSSICGKGVEVVEVVASVDPLLLECADLADVVERLPCIDNLIALLE